MREHRGLVGHFAGMQVDRDIQFLHALPEGQVLVLVEIVPIGLAIDERAAEAEFPDGPLELGGRGAGVLHGEMGEAGIAIRPLLHLASEEVVGAAGKADGLHLHRARPARPAW